jgi:hypothetical protein
MYTRNEKAISKGLTFRDLTRTARDTLEWYRSLPPDVQRRVLPGIEAQDTLENSMAHERELLDQWYDYTGSRG